MIPARIGRWMALGAHLGLFALLTGKIIGLGAPAVTPTALRLLLQVGPLLFVLRGLLHGRRNTHVWASYLALFYLVLGIDDVAAGHSGWGVATVLLALILFSGCFVYVRRQPRVRHE